MNAEDPDIIIITEEEANERLDKILAKRFQEKYSRSYFQYLIDERLALLNGKPVKKRIKPQAGDEIEIEFIATPEANLTPESIPLTILYEDDYLIAINKPVGMVVHPAPGHWSGTFVNALLAHCQGALEARQDDLRPGIVHRLDKDTSGVLVAAKTSFAQQKMIELFAARQVYKEYLAICVGNPGNGEINAPIGRHPIHRKQMAVLPNGRQAISFCRTLKSDQHLAIVSVVIATGRTHQIRVHLKHRGSPVLGDPVYGSLTVNKKYAATYQFLHASRIRFIHPITQVELDIVALPPENMTNMLKKIDPDWSFNQGQPPCD